MARGPHKQFDTDAALERAMELFWAQGYEATSLSELLAHMGIARKSLYDTFGSKRDLFVAALDRYSATVLQQVLDELGRPGSPVRNIRRVLQHWRDANAASDSRGCMLGNNIAHFDRDDPDMARVLAAHYEGLEAAFVAALERGKQAGEIRDDVHVRDLARLIVSAAQGMALIERFQSGAVARSVVRAAIGLLEAAAPAS